MMRHPDIAITYIGGPTALLEIDGLRFLTDPTFDPPGGNYVDGPVTLHKTAGPAMQPEELGPVDAILLSHDHHYDNFDNAGRHFARSVPMVLTTRQGADWLGANAKGLEPWQTIDLTTPDSRLLPVTATPARHGPKGGDRGPAIGFVLGVGTVDEPDVYFAGDTVWYDGIAEVAQRFRIRIAILNMGAAKVPAAGLDPVTMTAEGGVEFARHFPDALIVPLHFEGWTHFTESKSDIERVFATAGLKDRLHWPIAGERIEV